MQSMICMNRAISDCVWLTRIMKSANEKGIETKFMDSGFVW